MLQVSSARSGVHVRGLIDWGGLVVSDSIIVTMIVDIYVRDWLVDRTQTQEKIQVRDVLRAKVLCVSLLDYSKGVGLPRWPCRCLWAGGIVEEVRGSLGEVTLSTS